jgi:hypothetical protein
MSYGKHSIPQQGREPDGRTGNPRRAPADETLFADVIWRASWWLIGTLPRHSKSQPDAESLLHALWRRCPVKATL